MLNISIHERNATDRKDYGFSKILDLLGNIKSGIECKEILEQLKTI